MLKISESLIIRILLLLVLCIYFYLSTKFLSLKMQDGYGAGIFPKLISVVLFILLIKDFFSPTKKNISSRDNLTLIIFLTVVSIPLYFINKLGMYVVLSLFLLYLNHILKLTPLKNLVYTSLSMVIIHFLFVKIFKLSFPRIDIF